MSGLLQALVNGDDSCGPVNPVSQLAKRLGGGGEGAQLGRVSLLEVLLYHTEADMILRRTASLP